MSVISVIKPDNVGNFCHLPPLIGICGNPGAGKSEVQKIIAEAFDYVPGDDGEPLRMIAMSQFGLAHDDVYTQAGKNGWSEINGYRIQNRDVLGRIGNALETQFGDDILPWLATKNLYPGKRYSFASVRRQQGIVYRLKGGIILGVRRPGADRSRYEFDRFDESLVDVWIDNRGDLEDLKNEVYRAIDGVEAVRWRVHAGNLNSAQ